MASGPPAGSTPHHCRFTRLTQKAPLMPDTQPDSRKPHQRLRTSYRTRPPSDLLSNAAVDGGLVDRHGADANQQRLVADVVDAPMTVAMRGWADDSDEKSPAPNCGERPAGGSG